MAPATTVIRVGTAEAAGVGVTRGELRVGDTPDGEAVTIPVAIVRGAGEGPVLWINGCVHGDEYCGAFIIHEMLRTLDAASSVRGRGGAADTQHHGLSARPADEPVRHALASVT